MLNSSISEGAVEHSETEGIIKVISNYKTPSVIFLRKNDSPLKEGAEARIDFDIDYGQPQKLYPHSKYCKNALPDIRTGF